MKLKLISLKFTVLRKSVQLPINALDTLDEKSIQKVFPSTVSLI